MSRINFRFWIGAAALAMLASSPAIGQVAPMTGTVVDPAGNPVAGAALGTYDSSTGAGVGSALTDATGAFTVDAPATFDLHVIPPAATSWLPRWYLAQPFPGGGAYGTITLELGRWVSGTVTDEGGSPLSNVQVESWRTDTLTSNDGSVVTGATGAYSILVSASCHMRFRHLDAGTNRPAKWRNNQSFAGDTTGFDVTLPAGIVLSGTVVNTGGTPQSGWLIESWDAGTNTYNEGADTTDAGGAFSVVVSKQCHLRAWLPGSSYPARWKSNLSFSADTSGYTIVAEQGITLSGRVVNGAGTGLGGFRVESWDGGTNEYNEGAVVTAADGSYSLLVSKACHVRVTDTAAGSAYPTKWLENLSFATDTGGYTIVMSPGIFITGRAVSGGDVPLAGIRVMTWEEPSWGYNEGDGLTAADGTFVARVSRNYHLRLTDTAAGSRRPARWCLRESASAATPDGGTESIGDLVLVSGYYITGTVVSPSGSPVSGAAVDTWNSLISSYNEGQVTTGAGGTFTALVSPDFLIRARVPGSTTTLPRNQLGSISSDTSWGNVPLRAAYVLSGTITANNNNPLSNVVVQSYSTTGIREAYGVATSGGSGFYSVSTSSDYHVRVIPFMTDSQSSRWEFDKSANGNVSKNYKLNADNAVKFLPSGSFTNAQLTHVMFDFDNIGGAYDTKMVVLDGLMLAHLKNYSPDTYTLSFWQAQNGTYTFGLDAVSGVDKVRSGYVTLTVAGRRSLHNEILKGIIP